MESTELCAGAVILRIPGGCPPEVSGGVYESGGVRRVSKEVLRGRACEVLVLQRKKGHYDNPKGHVEASRGENLYETTMREIEEECGIGRGETAFVEGFHEVCSYRNQHATRSKTVHWFLCLSTCARAAEPDLTRVTSVLADYKWLAPREAEALIFHEHSKVIVRRMVSFLCEPPRAINDGTPERGDARRDR